MFNNLSQKKLVGIAILLVTVLVLTSGFVWVKNRGFITVNLTASASKNFDYSFVNMENGQVVTGKTTKTTIKQLLPAGNYEVYVTTETASFITKAKAGNFLSTKEVAGALTTEKDRSFIGYNSGPCNTVVNGILYSYECNGEIAEVAKHLPANSNTPTYTSLIKRATTAPINGIAYTSQGTIIFTDAVFKSDVDLESNYTIGILGDDFNVTNLRTIDNIGLGIKYQITAFKEGFLIYSPESTKAFYFSSLEAQPVEIDLNFTRQSDDSQNGLQAASSLILAYTSSQRAGGTDTEEDALDERVKSALTIQNDGLVKKYSIVGSVAKVLPCATKLCVLYSNKQLRVYDMDGKTLQELAVYRNISDIYQYNGQTKLIAAAGVIDYNPDRKSDYYDYSFGKYRYCGIQENTTGYTLCLIDARNNRLALAINSQANVTVPVDKLAAKLQTSQSIDAISLYQKFLFVTPRIGNDGNQTRETVYTDREIQESNNIVAREVKAAGLTAAQLTVINTVDPF